MFRDRGFDEVSVVLAESSSELVVVMKVKIGLEGEGVDNRLRVILAVWLDGVWYEAVMWRLRDK